MLSSPPSFRSTQDAEADVEVREPSAPTTPVASAERAENQDQGSDVRQAVHEAPPLSSAVGPKRRPRTRHAIPVSQAQLDQFETDLPPCGPFHDVSTDINFQVRTSKIALTYARCPVPIEEVYAQLSTNSRAINGMRGVVEPHRDGFPHVHVIVQKKNSAIAYRSLLLSYQNIVYRCDIRTLSTKKYQLNWHVYLEKHGVPTTWGNYETPVVSSSKTPQELIATARDTGIQDALHEYIEGVGGGYITCLLSDEDWRS